MAMEEKMKKKVVAAIDFGTTFSGFSYVYRDKPDKIHINKTWDGATQALLSEKIPTSLLLNKDGSRHSFGYKAEESFVELYNEGKIDGHLLFRRFKMTLNNLTDLKAKTLVDDVTGTRKEEASKLFMLSIEYLKEEILAALKGYSQKDIHFILTVPATWNDKAKHLMRVAAFDAGIQNEQLTLALESEVASVWCRNLPVTLDGTTLAQMGKGTKYMLVDLGGGTADIAIHIIDEGGDIRADSVPAGGDYGADNVDKTFFQVLEQNFFGPDVFKRFRTEARGEYFDLLRDFEVQKRTAKLEKRNTIKLDVPDPLMKFAEEKFGTNQVHDEVQKCTFTGLQLKGNKKLALEFSFMEFLFQYSIRSLLGDMQELLKVHDDAKWVVVVGGFADCEFVQAAIKDELKQDELKPAVPVFPLGCNIVVLQGAALYGLRPNVVKARKAHFTYGFKGDNDDFRKLVTIEQSISQDYVFTEVREPPAGVDNIEFSLYSSTDPNPKKVTDRTCVKLNTFFGQLPPKKKPAENKYELSVMFGDTELMFRIKFLSTGNEQIEYVNFK